VHTHVFIAGEMLGQLLPNRSDVEVKPQHVYGDEYAHESAQTHPYSYQTVSTCQQAQTDINRFPSKTTGSFGQE
jgi:hypothetical protein